MAKSEITISKKQVVTEVEVPVGVTLHLTALEALIVKSVLGKVSCGTVIASVYDALSSKFPEFQRIEVSGNNGEYVGPLRLGAMPTEEKALSMLRV
jgi:hypothetical protein